MTPQRDRSRSPPLVSHQRGDNQAWSNTALRIYVTTPTYASVVSHDLGHITYATRALAVPAAVPPVPTRALAAVPPDAGAGLGPAQPASEADAGADAAQAEADAGAGASQPASEPDATDAIEQEAPEGVGPNDGVTN